MTIFENLYFVVMIGIMGVVFPVVGYCFASLMEELS